MRSSAVPGQAAQGWLNGFIGVLIFSGSLPATRVADAGFSPLFLTGARATIAGLLALALLLMFREKRPEKADLPALLMVAAGVVVGFPLLTALALTHLTAARCILYIGLLPLSTALFAIMRGGERPHPCFWIFSLAGSALIAGYALTHGAGIASAGDAMMVAAIAICGLGYAEGARLTRRLGGWQVISWALVLSLPLMAGVMLAVWPAGLRAVQPGAWAGLAYVSVFSMLIGFLFWYRGLAQGGIAAVGQLQLLQPGFGLLLAATLLHESVGWALIAVMGAVALCVAAARRFA
jgi:drug/metabolite transporter (DMT)-like permease